jgi:hypothetical protein
MPLRNDDLERALRATQAIARHAGAAGTDLVVLHRLRRICVLLPSIATVARVVPANDRNFEVERRELAVSRYLSERKAPVVAPSAMMGREPFLAEGMLVTLWPHVAHAKADYEDRDKLAGAAHALRRVHDAFAGYPGALPRYRDRIEECATLLRDVDALPGLDESDRRFLMRVHERSSDALAAFDVSSCPIHGDAHLGNVFFTANGPLWMDFETACRGPHEWDAAGVPHLPAFAWLDPRLYAIMADLRSVCVVVWCCVLSADPEKRAAAQWQLESLKAREGAAVGAR